MIGPGFPTVNSRGSYCPEAERYDCCGSRRCRECPRGTVTLYGEDRFLGARLLVLHEKMMNRSWWQPQIGLEYLAWIQRRLLRAFVALEKADNERIPLRLTGAMFDSVDADRVCEIAGMELLTDEERNDLMLLAVLERARRSDGDA